MQLKIKQNDNYIKCHLINKYYQLQKILDHMKYTKYYFLQKINQYYLIY